MSCEVKFRLSVDVVENIELVPDGIRRNRVFSDGIWKGLLTKTTLRKMGVKAGTPLISLRAKGNVVPAFVPAAIFVPERAIEATGNQP